MLFERPVEGWCCGAVCVQPSDGSVWFIERDHSDIASSHNRLWKLDADGSQALLCELEDQDPFAIECDPLTETVWVATLNHGLLRFLADGTPAGRVELKAYNLAFGRGSLWAISTTALHQLDSSGKTVLSAALDRPTQQAWLAIFDDTDR